MPHMYKGAVSSQVMRYRFRSFDAPHSGLYEGLDQGRTFMGSERLFDLRQLEAFAAVISTGSVTGAAKVIGKSQPVVSRLIQELEGDLGFDLFTRYGRRITPTENGVSFYREVERLLDDARRTRVRAEDMARRRTESIEIASTAAMASTIVPSALRILKESGNLPPNVTVRIQTSEAVIQSLASGAADIGIASMPLNHPGLEVPWIAEVSCVCVLPEDAPLARKETIELTDLADWQLVTLLNPYRVLGRISAAIERVHLETPSVIRTNSSAAALQMVKAGLGAALLEPVSPIIQNIEGLAVRPLSVHIPYLWGVVTPVGVPGSPVLPLLIKAMADASKVGLPGYRERDVRDLEAILKNIYDFDAVDADGDGQGVD